MESFESWPKIWYIQLSSQVYEGAWVEEIKVILWLLTQDFCSMTISNISAEVIETVVTKFNVEPSWA